MLSLSKLILIEAWTLINLFLMGSVSYTFTKSLNQLTRILMSLIFGLFIIVFSGYIVGGLGVSEKLFFRALSILVGILSCLGWLYAQRKFFQPLQNQNFNENPRTLNTAKFDSFLSNRNNLVLLIKIIPMSLIPIILPFLYFTRHQSFIPAFTRGNNDIAAIILESESISRSGFRNSGFLVNQDFSFFAKSNDFGAPAFLSWLSAVNNIQSWEAVAPLLCVIAFLIIFSFVIIVKQTTTPKKFSILLVSIVCIGNPPVLYLFAHTFLPQLLAMAIVVSLSALITCSSFFDSRDVLKKGFLLGSILSLLFYTYSFMAFLAFGAIIAAVIFIRLFFRPKIKSKNEYSDFLSSKFSSASFILKTFLVASLFMLIESIPYFKYGIARIFQVKDVIAGWPLIASPSIGNFTIVADFGVPGGRTLTLVSFTLIFFGFLYLVRNVFRNQRHFPSENAVFFLTTVAIPLVIISVIALNYGLSSYRAWKAMFFYTPGILVFVFFGGLLLRSSISDFREKMTYVICGLYIASNFLTWSPVINNTSSYPNLVTSKDLYSLNSDLIPYKIKTLNISLTPYFESMIAAVIVPAEKISVVSPAYFPPITNFATCTLIRNTDIQKYPDGIQQYQINNTYSIISYPAPCSSA